jgi:hypothetical protein
MHSNLPHILCLTEHHMKQLELEHFHIENYNLGARYCRKTLEKGGVSIFVHKLIISLNFTSFSIYIEVFIYRVEDNIIDNSR